MLENINLEIDKLLDLREKWIDENMEFILALNKAMSHLGESRSEYETQRHRVYEPVNGDAGIRVSKFRWGDGFVRGKDAGMYYTSLRVALNTKSVMQICIVDYDNCYHKITKYCGGWKAMQGRDNFIVPGEWMVLLQEAINIVDGQKDKSAIYKAEVELERLKEQLQVED